MADGHGCELSTFLNYTSSIIFIITKPKAKNTASRVFTINGVYMKALCELKMA